MLTTNLFTKEELDQFAEKNSVISLKTLATLMQKSDTTPQLATKLMNDFERKIKFATDFSIAEEYIKAYLFIGETFEQNPIACDKIIYANVKTILYQYIDRSIVQLADTFAYNNPADSVKMCERIKKLMDSYQLKENTIERNDQFIHLYSNAARNLYLEYYGMVFANGTRECSFHRNVNEVLEPRLRQFGVKPRDATKQVKDRDGNDVTLSYDYVVENCIY